MKNMMVYRGYFGSVEVNVEDDVLHGKLAFIQDLVLFEGTDAKGLKAAFYEAVDDYIEVCAEQGRAPNKPFKGSFNVRPGKELHQRAALLARRRRIPLNAIVTDALNEYLHKAER